MKTSNLKVFTFALALLATNIFAQPTPPGGGGGGSFTNYSYFLPNTNFFIGVEGTNLVVSWISSTNKIYLLEHRATLNGGTPWSQLQNYILAAANTNKTRFVHTNILQSQPTHFYRLFDVTPIARDDFFAIDQDSSDNQLDIFQNDSDPNDDLFFISNLVPASHGGISYTLDATTFQYTPDSGFYGVDSFAYTITSDHGESATATVTVFVNKSGNSSPSVNDTIITLQTNVYSATFNALTNSSDPDGDTNALFSVGSPSLGSVSNDSSGNITYTRSPNSFGNDAFTYIVTDGNGGYAVGNVKILQVDTDGDGMPDQWEMANGLDPMNDDSTADPDGDGLPNLAEFELGTNPKVSDNPLNFQTVTNSQTVSGFVQLPLLGLHPTLAKLPIVLYVNGTPAEKTFLAQGPDGQWNLNWDTTFLTNGSYQIQVGFQYKDEAPLSEQTTIFGQVKTVQVNNLMSFDSLTAKFTDFLLINATLTTSSATYDVYLYDDYGNPLVYATGLTTTNGQISLYWDLTDGYGDQISFGNIQAFFYLHSQASPNGVHPNTPSGLTPIPPQWFLKESGNSGNSFAVAWGWDVYSTAFNNRRTELMLDGVINFLGDPSDPNSYNLLPSDNVAYANTFRYDSESDKKTLISALQSCNNFFWFGHGSFNGISGNSKNSTLGSAEVVTALGNLSSYSTPKTPKNDKHPYRLVILNGCETYSALWAGAFGIDFASGNSATMGQYLLAGRSPRAFVGWAGQIDVPDSPLWYQTDTDPEYADALSQLFYNWMAGNYLAYSLNQFANKATQNGFANANTFKISGCVDLTR